MSSGNHTSKGLSNLIPNKNKKPIMNKHTITDFLFNNGFNLWQCEMQTAARPRAEFKRCTMKDIQDFVDMMSTETVTDTNREAGVSCMETTSQTCFYDADRNLKYSKFRFHTASNKIDISIEVDSKNEVRITDHNTQAYISASFIKE